MLTNTKTREQWLNSAMDALRRHFAKNGYTVPENVRATCGFPSRSATARKNRRIGECWDSRASNDKTFEIFISPMIADPLEVAAILAHELAHATVGLEAGHKAPFKKCAYAIGLEGPAKSTTAGEAFKLWFASQTVMLGDYPHATLNATSGAKKQTTRLIKCSCPECADDNLPYIVRLSASTLAMGAPICPIHNIPLEEG